jgi:hypothetical protein
VAARPGGGVCSEKKKKFFRNLAPVPALRGTAAAVRLTADKPAPRELGGCVVFFFFFNFVVGWFSSGVTNFFYVSYFSWFGSFTDLIFFPLLCWVQSLIRPGPGGVEMFFFFFFFFFLFKFGNVLNLKSIVHFKGLVGEAANHLLVVHFICCYLNIVDM